MKKYIIGLTALILAICLTGFTGLSKKLTTVAVVYTGDVYNISDVENPSNWQVMTPPSCFGLDKACQITISDTYINWSSWTLSSNVRIDANGTMSWGYAPFNIANRSTGNSISSIIYNKD